MHSAFLNRWSSYSQNVTPAEVHSPKHQEDHNLSKGCNIEDVEEAINTNEESVDERYVHFSDESHLNVEDPS